MTWIWGDNPEGIEYYSPPMKLGEKEQPRVLGAEPRRGSIFIVL